VKTIHHLNEMKRPVRANYPDIIVDHAIESQKAKQLYQIIK